MKDTYLLVVIFLASGTLLCLIALPLIAGRIPRNRWYGMRVPKTLASDEVWYPANRFAGRALFRSGRLIAAGSLILLGALLLGAPLTVDQVGYIGLALTLIPLTVAVVQSLLYLRRL